eukprot:232965_1
MSTHSKYKNSPYQIALINKCHICDELQQIVNCHHHDCKTQKIQYCHSCAIFIHKKKSHKFTLRRLSQSSTSINNIMHSSASIQNEETKINEYPSDVRSVSFDTKVSLELITIQCEGLCQEMHSPEHLFVCKHSDCVQKQKILCPTCAKLKHDTFKSHSFDEKNIICVKSLMQPDETNFKSGKSDGQLVVRGIDAVEALLWKSRWLGAMPANILHIGIDVFMRQCGTINTMVDSALGSSILHSAVHASTIGAGIGAIIATGIEWALIWRQYHKKKISKKEAMILGGSALAVNGVSAAAFFGFMSLGAVMGTPLGPVGTVIGSIVGAIACGIITRKCLNKLADEYFKEKHENRTVLQKEAMHFFFGDEHYDIDDITKFNEKKLKREYHRLCLIYHPDRKNGDYIDWLKLSSYYGILTAICEEKNGNGNGNPVAKSDGSGCIFVNLAQGIFLIKHHPDLSGSMLNNTLSTSSSSETKSYDTITAMYSHLGSASQNKIIE